MNEKKFNIILLIAFLTTSFLIVAVNFIIDPGNIYLKKILVEREEKSIYEAFNSSKYGLHYKGNERFFKVLLAKNFNPNTYDCVAIGSSHIMQISSIRGNRIKKYCDNMLNLGVSGGSFEDILIFLGVLQQTNFSPKNIFIGIDPWTLKPNMDPRYTPYKAYLEYFLAKNNIKTDIYNSNDVFSRGNEIKNLYNLEYTKESLRELRKNGFKLELTEKFHYTEVSKDPTESFLPEATTLKDGSHVYASGYVDKNETFKDYNKEPSYKLNGKSIDPKSILILKKVFKLVQSKTNLYIILTPYHHSAFSDKNSKFLKYFTEVESEIKKIATERNIKVIGSYKPTRVNCSPEEFFDYMHPKPSCVDKIFTVSSK